jgi:predicted aspartyl protease
MGLTHVTVALRVPGSTNDKYEALFVVDTGTTDSMAPASELAKVGIHPVGRTTYELADGSVHEFPFTLAQVEFMGDHRRSSHPGSRRGASRSSA